MLDSAQRRYGFFYVARCPAWCHATTQATLLLASSDQALRAALVLTPAKEA